MSRMTRCVKGLAACIALEAAMQAPGLADPAPSGGAFVDRFTTLDPARWFASNGWSNGAYHNCTWSAANVKVNNLVQLALSNQPSKDRPFTCAEVQSRAFYSYGTFEVRMRPAPGAGVNSTFFIYTGRPHGNPHDEIDFEFLGKDPKGVFLNYFASGRSDPQTVNFDFDATGAAHDYAFKWTPDSIQWFADGRLIREVKKSSETNIPTTPQKLYISIWTGTGWDQEAWMGRFEYPGQPLIAEYEYVAYTPLGAPCQFPSSIACRDQAGDGRAP